MSWKAVEMQVALPRVQDAGKIQEQLQKQGEQMQETLTQAQLKQEEIKRSKVSSSEKTEKVKSDQKQQDEEMEEKERSNTLNKSDAEHPYLGTEIDINL